MPRAQPQCLLFVATTAIGRGAILPASSGREASRGTGLVSLPTSECDATVSCSLPDDSG